MNYELPSIGADGKQIGKLNGASATIKYINIRRRSLSLWFWHEFNLCLLCSSICILFMPTLKLVSEWHSKIQIQQCEMHFSLFCHVVCCSKINNYNIIISVYILYLGSNESISDYFYISV